MSRVDVDLHQLELRHRDLRIHDGEQRRRMIGSVAEIGQQVPVIVVRDGERYVLIDGYLRVEALRRLHRDTVIATAWSLSEVEALVHHRHLAVARRAALEDAWLLGRLRDCGLSLDEQARRLCRSKSWISRRLGLLDALAAAAQERVRAGTVPPHAAMKYLVPLARANKRQCELLLTGARRHPRFGSRARRALRRMATRRPRRQGAHRRPAVAVPARAVVDEGRCPRTSLPPSKRT